MHNPPGISGVRATGDGEFANGGDRRQRFTAKAERGDTEQIISSEATQSRCFCQGFALRPSGLPRLLSGLFFIAGR